MRLRWFFCVLAAVALLPLTASAAPTSNGTTGLFELVTGETLPQGRFQVALYANKFDRSVYSTLRVPSGGGPLTDFDPDIGLDIYEYSLSGAYGVLNWLEIGVKAPFTSVHGSRPFEGTAIAPFLWNDVLEFQDEISVSEYGDTTVSLKFRLLNAVPQRLTLALTLEGKIPTADDEASIGTGEFDYGARLSFSKSWNRAGIHLSAGYFFNEDPTVRTALGELEVLEDSIYGGIGLDFCPLRNENLKLILELEGATGGYSEQEFNRFVTDELNAVLGFRYFFTPKKIANTERMNSYSVSIGAGVRYAILESLLDESDTPDITNDEVSDSQNPIGFVAHLSISPRLNADNCIAKPKTPTPTPRPIPPSVTLTADPSAWTIPIENINDDGSIDPLVDEEGNETPITSRIRALARDPNGDDENVTYEWTYRIGDLNEVYVVTDADGNPVTTPEFDFTFTTDDPEEIPTYTFMVKVTDEEGLTDESEFQVTFSVIKPIEQMVSLPIVYFDFDQSIVREEDGQRLSDALDTLLDLVRLAEEGQTPRLAIRLEGYTCPIGTTEYNLALGERRSEAVNTYLNALGLDQFYMIDRVSFGEEEQFLVVPCTVPNCIDQQTELSPNRRTETKITGGLPAEGVNVNPDNLDPALQDEE